MLNVLTLVIAGHPWTVTWAFTLWGAKAAVALGWDPASSAFWSSGFPGTALERSVFRDNISIMDVGIILGALTAAGLAGRFAPTWKMPWRSAAAVLGGLLMGYGARLAFGCNIGAFFSGDWKRSWMISRLRTKSRVWRARMSSKAASRMIASRAIGSYLHARSPAGRRQRLGLQYPGRG